MTRPTFIFSPRMVRYLAPLAFFLFICWIIVDADTGDYNIFIESVKTIPLGDKWGHLVLYGALSLILSLALRLRSFKWHGFNIFWGAFIVGVFAIGEEFTQLAFASRSFDLIDMLADVVGISLASLGCHLLRVYKSDIKLWLLALVDDVLPDGANHN